MSTMGFYNSHQCKFVDDENTLRHSTRYQLIRDEINRLNNPAYGKVDWDKIKVLCEDIARTDGLNFLVTLYYTTALVKANGISGLATGLELQLAMLMHLYNKKQANLVKCAELYRWMIARIGDDLRRLDPSDAQLKDLYRCERSCTDIYAFFLELHPQHVPDFEAMTYVIFDHIEWLEGKSQPAEPKPVIVEEPDEKPLERPQPPQRRFRSYVLFGSGILLGLSAFALTDYVQNQSDAFINQLTTEKIAVKALSADNVEQLHQQYSPSDFLNNQPRLVSMYLRQVNDDIQAPTGMRFTQALSLLDTLKHLYPNTPQVGSSDRYMAEIESRFSTQYRRFKTARTNIANLQKTINQSRSKKMASLSEKLNDYAMGLSPVYGRISYIEKQLSNNDIVEVKKELQQLDTEIKGLALRYSTLVNQSQVMETNGRLRYKNTLK